MSVFPRNVGRKPHWASGSHGSLLGRERSPAYLAFGWAVRRWSVRWALLLALLAETNSTLDTWLRNTRRKDRETTPTGRSMRPTLRKCVALPDGASSGQGRHPTRPLVLTPSPHNSHPRVLFLYNTAPKTKISYFCWWSARKTDTCFSTAGKVDEIRFIEKDIGLHSSPPL